MRTLFDVGVGVADHLGQLNLFIGGSTKGGAVDGGILNRPHHFRVAMAENHRTPGTDIIDIALVVGIVDATALRRVR